MSAHNLLILALSLIPLFRTSAAGLAFVIHVCTSQRVKERSNDVPQLWFSLKTGTKMTGRWHILLVMWFS
jgi:hypothetical protein